MVSIHLRPADIEERRVPSHWEGDTLKCAGNDSSVDTSVERKTLFVVLAKLTDGTAKSALSGFSRVRDQIDARMRFSMTYDRSNEMSDHAAVTEKTGVTVYFANPHSPRQRGINENTNGLLSQYMPKGAYRSFLSHRGLDDIAFELNVRTHKTLG